VAEAEAIPFVAKTINIVPLKPKTGDNVANTELWKR